MKTTQATLIISGMTCDHCVKTVQGTVQALKGVSQVKVDLASQKADVVYSPDLVTLDQIKKAIVDAGYQVTG